jgi:haloalkane dehalogenase
VVEVEPARVDGIAYREAAPAGDPGGHPVLCVHGFPQSSYMWRDLLQAIAGAGRRSVAPDLIGYGDTAPDPPGTWERQVEHIERFRSMVGLDRVVLVVHDWGGLIGLRWACDHPEAVSAMVISNTGFFPDGKWNAMAVVLRTEGEGEQLVDNLSRDAFGAMLKDLSSSFDDAAIAEYFKAFQSEAGRRGPLELYRSGDFDKLEPYRDRVAQLGVPTLILWGENDAFAPVAAAHRFHHEIPGSKLAVVEGAGHFVYEDDPQRCAREVVEFLTDSGS